MAGAKNLTVCFVKIEYKNVDEGEKGSVSLRHFDV